MLLIHKTIDPILRKVISYLIIQIVHCSESIQAIEI